MFWVWIQMVLSRIYNLYIEPVPLVCHKLEWDGGSCFWSYGKMCLPLKMKRDSVIETYPLWHVDLGNFCSWILLGWSAEVVPKGSCSKTTRQKIISPGKPENCLNKCHMQQGNSDKNRQKFPKPQRCQLRVTGGLKHVILSSIQLPKAAPVLYVEDISTSLLQASLWGRQRWLE